MPSTLINRRDLAFQLYEVLGIEALTRRPRYAEHGRDTFEAVIDTAEAIAERHFAPHNAELDRNEPTFDGERVHIIPEVGEALRHYIEAGFMAAGHDEAAGGMQLPYVVTQACAAFFQAANISTAAYPFLTGAAANLLDAFGSPQQKERYMTPMLEGRYFGTMALSEPQAGSSLSDIRTRAEPQDDGTYRLFGNKMWISGGEHDLSENIVHLVLAKIPGGPAGVKGISLFIVPKYLVNDDGTRGPRNDVRLAGLNHKMGYRGTTNTLLNFGEEDGALGYLVGEPHQGLRCMFHMMNEARIGVGLGAVMLGYAGYLYSLEYARTRPQGRHPGDKDPSTPQVRLIEHADIRRMLLAQKAAVEGGLGLCLLSARLVDDKATAEDPAEREAAATLLEILTPIAKAWPSQYCLEANGHAIQILGGYGYTRDYPVEQYYRDNRLNPIHEGTNGIQAIDLLGRKVTMQGGAAYHLLLERINATVDAAAEHTELAEYAEGLAAAGRRLVETTRVLTSAAAEGKVALSLANATHYLDLLGHIVIAWIWLDQAIAALRGLEAAQGTERDFYLGKLRTCRYFFRFELPRTAAWATLLGKLDDTTLGMPEAGF
ncbi:acyl-CoA dehydrogenase [Oceanibacterium hippocampi]|uniref:Acyl-CoA dehydrogenase, short-chain specific n=1 Tax=Oceanibacterium hippocampi TaxID=745714 RepID=A0A1Y5TXI1_9PROT|nr:acyl-CoA dehydrogenase [Oceanibacterium hippocampi]SLN70392.1 Acyl-CoA dehydrogenase, short-chain specific [Oceanibacterium hippocampi]